MNIRQDVVEAPPVDIIQKNQMRNNRHLILVPFSISIDGKEGKIGKIDDLHSDSPTLTITFNQVLYSSMLCDILNALNALV